MNQSERALKPHRLPGESAVDYRVRRKSAQIAVEKYMHDGRMIFVSTQIVKLPEKDVDEKVDEAIRQGQFRDVKHVTTKSGEQFRIARTKGTTYRKPKDD